ncbi:MULTISPECIES: sugar phosphate isomerase/epimerase family protein [Bacillaceae]|uniref:sugar phosphate isomerase/epimerase family protein n=1 Tax=Bacillaceae TaxID=186817 RepID=UPI0011A99C51|nr:MULTISPECIES: sugar phosphate isomerase/epimerase family protein [Bacillaceae]MED4473947.1 sugar phosphate isomerase/epimerase [Oceanobacillus caeni]
MKLACLTNAWGGVWGTPGGVTSINDSYYMSSGSTEEALKDVSESGYTGFEIFEGNLLAYEVEEFKELMEKYNLELVGVYTGANFIYPDIWEEEKSKIERVIRRASTLNCLNVVIGGGAIRSTGILDEDYKVLGDKLNQIKELSEEHGLVAHYHPHLGSMVESPEQIDKLYQHTSINLCPDTAHLEAGGGDPLAIISKYSNKVKYIHLKDFHDGKFLPLGEGHQDFTSMLDKLTSLKDYSGWITVEFDTYEDAKYAARVSKEFLDKELKDSVKS